MTLGRAKRASRWAPLLLAAFLLLVAAPAFAHPSWGIVADREGRVYFSDLETVWRLDRDGRLSVFRPRVEGVHVHELAIAADDEVKGDSLRYDPARETWHAGIWKRSTGGGETWLLEPTTKPPNGSGLAVDAGGNSYATQWLSNDDRRTMLWRHRADGRSELLFGDRRAAAGYRQIVVASVGGTAFAPDGSLLFGDGAFVRRLDPGGTVANIFEGASGTNIRGVSAGPDGQVIAADIGNRLVLAFGRNGQAHTIYTSPAGWAPSGLTHAGGRLLLLEAEQDPAHRSNRVRLVEIENGEGRVLAMPSAETAGRPARSRGGDRPPKGAGGGATMLAASLSAAAVLGFVIRSARRKALGRARASERVIQ